MGSANEMKRCYVTPLIGRAYTHNDSTVKNILTYWWPNEWPTFCKLHFYMKFSVAWPGIKRPMVTILPIVWQHCSHGNRLLKRHRITQERDRFTTDALFIPLKSSLTFRFHHAMNEYGVSSMAYCYSQCFLYIYFNYASASKLLIPSWGHIRIFVIKLNISVIKDTAWKHLSLTYGRYGSNMFI